MFDLGLVKLNQSPFNKGWLVNPHQELIKKTKLKTVKAVSVNHITTGKANDQALSKEISCRRLNQWKGLSIALCLPDGKNSFFANKRYIQLYW